MASDKNYTSKNKLNGSSRMQLDPSDIFIKREASNRLTQNDITVNNERTTLINGKFANLVRLVFHKIT